MTFDKNEYMRKWYKEKGLEYHREYREKNREQRRIWNREWIKNNNSRYNASKYIYREKIKLEVLKYYSINGVIECKKCGFNNIDALCLDHINNDGAEQRLKMKISGRGYFGMNTYEVLKKLNYPTGIQILCANCNMIKELTRKKDKRLLNVFYKNRTKGGV
jgi:hypothetical protein